MKETPKTNQATTPTSTTSATSSTPKFKPYQLKAKRDIIEPSIEERPIDPKKLKRMKKS